MRKLHLICLAAVLALGGFAASSASAATHWVPPKALSWYWQLDGSIKTTGPQANADAYDVDGFGTSAATVGQLHAAGHHTICYISAGTSESWRPDFGRFQASDKGSGVSGWAGENWLDTRSANVRAIMAARVQDQCAAKGFDAVEFDNVDGYDNGSGFPLTAATQVDYNTFLAQTAHGSGLAAFLKNDVGQVPQLASQFDGAINEQCAQYGECGDYSAFLNAGKPVLQAEYAGGSGFCASANAAGRMAALYSESLNGATYTPCFAGSTLSPVQSGGSATTPPAQSGGPSTPTPPAQTGGGSAPATTPPAAGGGTKTTPKPVVKPRHKKKSTKKSTARRRAAREAARRAKRHAAKHPKRHVTKHGKRHAKHVSKGRKRA
jgi:hypothetical protein